MITPLSTLDNSLTIEEASRNFVRGMAYYYEYTKWPITLKKWGKLLSGETSGASAKRRRMNEFVELGIKQELTAPGVFSGLVGIATRGQIDLSWDPEDCLPTPVTGMAYEKIGESYYLVFQVFRSRVVGVDAPPKRIQEGRRFGYLVTHGCIGTLTRIFREVSEVLTAETDLADQHIREWNAILQRQAGTKLSLVVTISNIGKYDTFVRSQARVAVGATDSPDAELIRVSVQALEEKDPSRGSSYLVVKSRTAETRTFQATLDPQMSRRLHGTYMGELNFIRLGVIASSGKAESIVYSSVTPFSVQARRRALEKVEEIPVKISD